MRSGVLLDTGPLVAYLSERDRHHDWAVETFAALDLPAVTCEPVLAEACFITARNGLPAADVLKHVSLSKIRIGLRLDEEMPSVRALMERYADVPMSLADACLVRLAEITRLPICTLDSDFAIYRAHRRHPLALISPARTHSMHEP